MRLCGVFAGAPLNPGACICSSARSSGVGRWSAASWGPACRLALSHRAWQPGHAPRHSISWGCAALRPLERHRHKSVPATFSASRNVSAAAAAAPPAPTANGQKQKGGKKQRKPQEDGIYKDTVNLPDTAFNMRANSTQREPQLQAWWAEQRVYETLRDSASKEPFTLHDGPPYANGDLHIGHALNKVLKDIIMKYQMLRGRRVKYVPGWDCHGLPIELKVLQSMTEEQRAGLTPIKLRRKARDFALKAVKSQRDQFKRMGVWGDWEEPYLTLNPGYEAAQLEVFGAMFLNGHIYRGRKPVHWSPSSQTALAESELEYPDGHTSRSVYVALPMETLGPNVTDPLRNDGLAQAALAVWTTTPWTMPANLAVAVNDRMDYSLVQEAGSGRKLVVATDLVATLAQKLGAELTPLGPSFPGSALEGCLYRHPFAGRTSPVVIGGSYITAESGTGLVHTAPGHGQEDYQVGQRCGLPLLSPVDDAGRFTDEAGAEFAGLAVLAEGNQAVIDKLSAVGALLKEEAYQHSYAYDWRTKQPIIFRATDQWFASVDGFRDAALAAIETVQWIPDSGQRRITSMTQGRSDWCISRQRKWGVPIPVFYHIETGEPLITPETIAHVAAVVREKGTDAWWLSETADLLPEGLRDRAEEYRRGDDTMDVWFDSGTSWATVLGEAGLPADLYLEGSDQHRGWFQSSLLTAVAAAGKSPYKAVLTHGFVLDERGFKMSKSLGNVVDPGMVIVGGQDQKAEPPYGADVLRLWVASVDSVGDVSIGPQILSQTADVYRKLRFTLRYILGNVADFDPARDAVPWESLPAVDRHMLHRFAVLLDDLRDSYDGYQFSRFYQAVQRFVVLELSNYYLDVAKDRLYVRGAGSADRRACQTVLAALLGGLLPAIAPVLPHMAEDAWQAVPYPTSAESVFLAGWQSPEAAWRELPADELTAVTQLLAIRDDVNQALERARTARLIGSALEAKVLLYVADPEVRGRMAALDAAPNGADPLRYAFIVSQVELVGSVERCGKAVTIEGIGEVAVGVERADGGKCGRCWNYSPQVRQDAEHPELCERCLPVIRDMGFQAPAPAAAVPEPATAAA